VNSSRLSETTSSNRSKEKTSTIDMPGGITGPISKLLSERRSHRHQWDIVVYVAVILLDAALVNVAFGLAYYLRYHILFNNNSLLHTLRRYFNGLGSELGNNSHATAHVKDVFASFSSFASLEVGIVIGLIAIFAFRGLYRMRLTGSWFRQAWMITSSATLGAAFLITYYFVFEPPSNSRLLVPFVWAMAIVVLCVWRLILSAVMGMLYRLGLGETRLLVVGSGRLGKMIMQHIAASPNLGYSMVGFLHDMDAPMGDFGRFKVLGTLDDLSMVIKSMQVDEVIIALPAHMHQQCIRAVRLCERLGASFKLVPDLYELSLSRIDMEAVEGIPLIGIKQVSLNSVQRVITRIVDIVVAILLIVIGSPLWLCIALGIALTSPGGVIYRSTRVGKDGKLFRQYKFRSMYRDSDGLKAALLAYNEAQGPIFKIKDDPRITPIGRFLRRTSFDEIPQLINIIRGEMSLVGPRPPLPNEVAQYEEWHKERLTMKPGMTGLWQVRGRSDLSFDEGVLMDLYYIQNWSLRLYFQILLRTIPAVLLGRGAY
jgi:exopolysaccharide biosynthesis polyprenyl glycosylphosphotransferase